MQTTNLCIRKTEILHFLVHEIIHFKWLLKEICTLHIVVFFFNKNIKCLIFLNYICTAGFSFSIFKSLRLFSLGTVVLTYKRDVWNLGSWKSILSSLQSLNNCRAKHNLICEIFLLQSFVLWGSRIWWGHNFKLDFSFSVPVTLLLLIVCGVV